MNWNPTETNEQVAFHQNFVNANFQGCMDLHPRQAQQNTLMQQRKSDEDFIRNFLSDLQYRRISKVKDNPIKIFEGKRFLLEIINKKREIEEKVCGLDVNDENFDLKSDSLMKDVNEIDEKILKFENDLKAPLKKALMKRLKKRKGIKERKFKYQALKKLSQEDIKEKHKIIDRLLSERSEEVEAVKREATLKRQADSVLHEVRRKKFEGKKMLNLLTALTKLRELRSKEEEQRGGYCSKQLTETFNSVMKRFQNLWENQIEVYKLEEKGLKIMLEENALPHVKESKFETNLLQWEKVLFGDITNDENEKRLTLADSNLEALIQVRRDWDQFLTEVSTPMASSIPPGWVLPPESEDDEWKAFTRPARKVSS